MSIRICIGFGSEPSETSREDKGNSILLFPETYVVVDTETTGLSPTWDDLIEIAAVKYHGGTEIDPFQSLIQPPNGPEIDPFIIELTGITPDSMRECSTMFLQPGCEFSDSCGIC